LAQILSTSGFHSFTKSDVAHGEILCAMIYGLALPSFGRAPAAKTTGFFKNNNSASGIRQDASGADSSHSSSNHCN
jgi:hypothetical protein